LLSGTSAFALDELSSPLYCSKDPVYSLELDSEDGAVRFVDFRFDVAGPYVDSGISCRRWLSSVLNSKAFLRVASEFRYKYVYSADKVVKVRTTGEARKVLYELCDRSPFCKVTTPYNLFNIASIFRGKPKLEIPGLCSRLPDELAAKKAPAAKEIAGSLPEEERPKFWNVKRKKLSLEFIDGDFFKDKIAIISARTFAAADLLLLSDVLKQNPGSKLFVLFDLSSAIASPDFQQFLELASEGVNLVPVYPHPGSTKPHALVAAATAKGGSTYSLLTQKIDEACQQTKYLDCTIGTAWEPKNQVGFTLKGSLNAACKNFYAH
jgi:hypothetical protein